MGRAASRAHATSQFDLVLGTRRGVGYGTVLTSLPNDSDRRELGRLVAQFERGSLSSEAVALLSEHRQQLESWPLLKELHERYCEHLVEIAKARYGAQPARTLRVFGFKVADRLFEDEKLQLVFDAGLLAQARQRSLVLLKAGLLNEEALVEALYLKEFERVAGAQCFAARERICGNYLGISAPPVNLNDVTAWRAAVIEVLKEPAIYEGVSARTRMQSLLGRVRPRAKRVEPPARRRQRYLR
jgi:hypothetical protein